MAVSAERDEQEVEGDQAVPALADPLGGGGGSSLQGWGGHLAQRAPLGQKPRRRVGDGEREEGEGRVCSELSAGSRLGVRPFGTPENWSRNDPSSLCGAAEGRSARRGWLAMLGRRGRVTPGLGPACATAPGAVGNRNAGGAGRPIQLCSSSHVSESQPLGAPLPSLQPGDGNVML